MYVNQFKTDPGIKKWKFTFVKQIINVWTIYLMKKNYVNFKTTIQNYLHINHYFLLVLCGCMSVVKNFYWNGNILYLISFRFIRYLSPVKYFLINRKNEDFKLLFHQNCRNNVNNGNINVGLIRFSSSAIVSIPLQRQNFTTLSGKIHCVASKLSCLCIELVETVF